ncbi:Serine-protein kinase ATM [Eumeta japonica]|uniref:Serine-protein kinase ATM n=1 Tax=Eumeta variegata TaxID=151549 RepID=A0A4C1Y6D0_EUMVA|nr:Serine-protein kinase ATM [Eumeta japonica]
MTFPMLTLLKRKAESSVGKTGPISRRRLVLPNVSRAWPTIVFIITISLWSKDITENYNYLKLDYKCVAWAAAISDKPMAAVYYGELWCADQNDGIPPASPQLTAELEGGEHVQSIFRKCFISIGEMDAIDGCGTGHLTDVEERRRHLITSRHYSDALLSHDIALSLDNTGNTYELHHGLAISLINSGLRHLAVEYVKTLPDNEDLDDIKYQCFMELGDWSLFVDTSELEKNSRNANVNFDSVLNALQYSCLKDVLTIQITKDFQSRLTLPFERAKIVISRMINKLNMDNCQSVYNVLAKLQLFAEIEDYLSVKCDKVPISELITKWQIENLSPYQDFKHIESIILQRSLILEQAAKNHTEYLKDIVMLQLKFSELANFNGRWQVSDRLIAIAKEMLKCDEVSLVESQMYWTKGHKDIALSFMRQIISTNSMAPKLHAVALRQYGSWMAESKYESAREIIEKYLMKSLDVLGPNGHTETRLKVYLDIAMFADSEYKQVVSYIKSSVFENKVRCVKNMRGAATTLKNSQQTMSRDEQAEQKKAMYTNTRLSNLEQAEIDNTYEEKKRFLVLAIKYYLFTLNQGEEDDFSIFRVISLWFENPTIDTMINDGDDGTFAELLNAVPSRKYLPVLPQLSPRLTTRTNSFSSNLRNIITKCAVDHPHHTLPILFGLKNSHKDKIILNTSSRSSANVERNDEPRVLVARQLVQQLAEAGSSLTTTIQQLDNMCDGRTSTSQNDLSNSNQITIPDVALQRHHDDANAACLDPMKVCRNAAVKALISFANYVSKDKKAVQQIPKAEPLVRLTNLDEVPVPTTTLKIQKNCIYTDFANEVKYDCEICLNAWLQHALTCSMQPTADPRICLSTTNLYPND